MPKTIQDLLNEFHTAQHIEPGDWYKSLTEEDRQLLYDWLQENIESFNLCIAAISEALVPIIEQVQKFADEIYKVFIENHLIEMDEVEEEQENNEN